MLESCANAPLRFGVQEIAYLFPTPPVEKEEELIALARFKIERYERNSRDWNPLLKKQYLISLHSHYLPNKVMSNSLSPASRVDFVLVTALPEERDAVLDKLPGYRQLPPAQDDIHSYYQVDLPITFSDHSTGQYRVIVMCLLGMGRVQAATATAHAIQRWRPRYILLLGIAGGLAVRNIQIGDILISDQIVDYELQKLTPQGPEVRWEVQRADPRLLEACNNYRSENWQETISVERPGKGQPKRHTGPIASGDKVIAFGEVLARYRDVWPKLIGVEMEAAGVAMAAFQSSGRPGFFMIRGVSDLADENKGSVDVEKWRAYACDAAASFAIDFLKSGPIPLSEIPLQVKTKRVEIILEGEFDEFTSGRRQDMVSVLAALLKVDPSHLRVLTVYQGSIVVILEMPVSAAERLYEMVTINDHRIRSLGIKSVWVEGREKARLSDKTRESERTVAGKTKDRVKIRPSDKTAGISHSGAEQLRRTIFSWYKKQPITIRASILSGIFTLLAAIIAVIFGPDIIIQQPDPTLTTIASSLPTNTLIPSPSPIPSMTPTHTPTPFCPYQGITDEETLSNLIHAEAQAVNTEDIKIVQAIFDPKAIFYDYAAIPAPKIWNSPIARYQNDLFVNTEFKNVQHFDIQPVGQGIAGNTAWYVSGSKGSYREGNQWIFFFNGSLVSENPAEYGSEHWILERNDRGCWVIVQMEFNAGHIPFP